MTYAKGVQPSLTLARRVGRFAYLQGRVGQSLYTLDVDGSKVHYLWYGANCEVEVSRHLFLITDVEYYRGDGVSTDRYALEAGWRF